MTKALCITCMLLGVILFIWGSNLSSAAMFEEQRVSQAEESGSRRPTLGPIRRGIREQEAENKQQMLNEAGQNIVSAETSSNWLRGIGIMLFIGGVAGFIFVRKK